MALWWILIPVTDPQCPTLTIGSTFPTSATFFEPKVISFIYIIQASLSIELEILYDARPQENGSSEEQTFLYRDENGKNQKSK